MSANPQNHIVLWSAPRCISTAFERSIMQLPNGKVLHEPFSLPYYYGPERRNRRFAHIPADSKRTYAQVERDILAEYEGKDFLFVKDMAYFIDHKIEDIVEGRFLPGVQHVFLIRNPQLAITSFYKGCVKPELTGWNYFDPIQAGFEQLYLLFRRFDNPVVVDADDLLDNPEPIMKAFCSATNLPYVEGMTSWQKGKVPEFDIWGGWHKNAAESTGFSRQIAEKHEEKVELSREAVEAIKHAQPCYDKMYINRILV